MDEDSSFAHPGVAMCFLVLSPRRAPPPFLHPHLLLNAPSMQPPPFLHPHLLPNAPSMHPALLPQRSADLMPKKEFPRGYISCKLCRRQKKRCAPLRSAAPPYITCGRCELAGVPCVCPSGSALVPSESSAPEAAGASRQRDPSPSITELSSCASTSAWYTQCERKVLEDGYPLKPQFIPRRGTLFPF
ncbi:hypothetical protein F5888DRAFT_1352081 [Russula emetica]|nr:hypothetical protein F5888DRAFT_1352081 [Russula emetica]